MTDRKEALTALLAKVEAGEAKASDMSQAFGAFGAPEEGVSWFTYNAYNGSIDAAKALHDAVLPGLTIRLIDHGAEFEDVGRWNAKVNWEHISWQPTFTAAGPFGHEGQCNNPARAWLIAVLKALIAQEGEQ